MNTTSRRDVLRGALALACFPALPIAGCASAGASRDGRPGARALRVAHMTDFHIQPELRAHEGVAAALAHMRGHNPDLLLTGGDLVMDAFDQDHARTTLVFDLFTRSLRDHWGKDAFHTLGNHDIWGWNKAKSKTTGDEPLWGKNYALDALRLDKPYRSIDRAGWHIISLDSIRPLDHGYTARLDDEQLDWLKNDLAAAKGRPILVVSHVPVLTVTCLANDDRVKDNAHTFSTSLMHSDSMILHQLFVSHGVKLCLSGHIHRLDRVETDGVTYICDGAVCGAWWEGRKNRCDEGYGIVDLYADGSFEHRYHAYGWRT